ncbi:MAG TPA: uroporphyrinogen decarboxylase family protein [Bacteroidota bacterium]|nr:uroporphyrinogen decarboxylase family protein [Bacteroidota bacterium]
MTRKERLMAAFHRKKPDHVPACPDISVMVPAKLTGRPFYELFLDGREHNGWTSATYAEAYVEAVKHFGIDGWYIYGGLKEIRPEGAPAFKETIVDRPNGKLVERVCDTPLGPLSEKELYFADEPPWRDEKPIKDLKRDFPRFRMLTGEGPWRWENVYHDRGRIGDLGVYVAMVPVFQDWWFNFRQGGFQQCFQDFVDDPDYMEEVHEFWMAWALANVRAMVAAEPDEIMLGGSSASLSVSSPSIFRKYELPFIQQASAICRQAGVISHLHICGRSRELIPIVAEQTDVDVMEPMEEPPGGNVDLKDVKKRYGSKLCIKGNINTFDFMLHATPAEVEAKCKRLIDDAGADGGFVLSTGDQCGRDTPHANLFKMVEVAETYGKY